MSKMNDLKNCMCGCIYAEKVCPNCNKITDKDRIEELEAKMAKAVEALKECEDDIDAYIQFQYPHDHPVQERCRQQYYATNPARVALAELKGETE